MARKCQPLALKIFGKSKMTTSVNDCQRIIYLQVVDNQRVLCCQR